MSRSILCAFLLFGAVTTTACGGAKPATSAGAPAPVAQAAAPAAGAANTYTGTVAETMNSGGYTYVRLKAEGKDEVWAAATEFPAKVGDRLTVALEMPMENFESKTLNRTFPVIYFVSGVSKDGQAIAGAPGGMAAPKMMPGHSPTATATVVEPIAPPDGGMSIADVWAKRTRLADKEITVRGKVVKVNSAIMGRNWVHLQDGSGSASDRTNDLTVTTDADVKVGDVVTMAGVLSVGKDFGAGYAYDAILEKGRIK